MRVRVGRVPCPIHPGCEVSPNMTTEPVGAASSDAFYDHLDECAQCRERPFDLCPVGAPLLMAAGASLAAELPPEAP